jgi:hypothetical protein
VVITCTAAATTPPSFSNTADHPQMAYINDCTWTSNPSVGTPNLVCS